MTPVRRPRPDPNDPGLALRSFRSVCRFLVEVSRLAAAVGILGTAVFLVGGPHLERWADARTAALLDAHRQAVHGPATAEIAAVRTQAARAEVAAADAHAAVLKLSPALGSLLCAQAQGRPLLRTCDVGGGRRIPYGELEALVDEADARRAR